ncbi:uncharacterized protein LOC110243664 [Exaiptasia diaphana]|uniref:E3 ubiquitin- ligase DZIP3 n=1 Tax=Exaiptasia diaphana TaxID=2652724 RepID=A0A913XJT7_EXADI|nr:uncharacterized protein LOC110243664 [Exaiptasia diaphana]KXJ11497.1 E3 ubiquitin-protein ligase DZIP3 [Exaiptasia diaphana]
MATHWATENKEKVNHAKLCRLLYDGGGTTVRAVVDRHCPPATLAATLKAKKPQLQKLRKPKGKVLNIDQWNNLYPPSGTSPSTKDFDITLLFVLIRNICGLTKPATGWDALPPPADTSSEANLARIKYYRNKIIGHNGNAEVDDIQYEAYWKEISSALVSLGLDQDDIDDLKSRPVGVEDYNKLLKEWQLDETDTKDHLSDIKSSIASGFTNIGEQIRQIQKSTPSETDKLFHQEFRSNISSKCSLYHPNTRAWILEKVKDHVESDSNEVLVIQAGPGMGKSVLAARICQMYQDCQENQSILGACHFFQHNDSSRNNPRLMLQSVAWQLCGYLPEYKVAVEKVLQSDHMRNHDISVLSCTELFTLLFEESFSHLGHEPTGKLVVVIDALDECCNSLKKEFFQVIRDKLYYLPSWIRFVMTTRPPPSISSQVPGATTKIDPNDSQNTEDLQSFFADKLKELSHLSSDQQQHSHMEQLVDLTGGLFLVASFVIDFLKKPRINSLAEALENFPKGKGITAVYEDYFSRLRDEITPYLKSEEGFYNMLDAVVKAKSPIEKNIFYDILGLPLKETRVPNNKKKEAINLLHQLFPVENDHVSPFHKTVVDWLTTGDHDFAAQGDGIGVLASACYNALMNAKQEIFEKKGQPTHITDKEIYALEFGFDYMEESARFNEEKVHAIVADPYVLCNMAIYTSEKLKTAVGPRFGADPLKRRLSVELQVIYDEIKTLHGIESRDSTKCIVPELTILQCLQFTFRTYNLLQIETEERALHYLKENHLPYHLRETSLKLANSGKDTKILSCNGGFLIAEECNQKTTVKKCQFDGKVVGKLNFKKAILRMSPDNCFIVAHDYENHPGDDIAIVDVATMKKVTSYRLPNLLRSLHVFGSHPWYIVARCFDNKIYIVEGDTGRLVGDPCAVLQNEDVLCVSNMGHILLVRTSDPPSMSAYIDGRFTDKDRLLCIPMQWVKNQSDNHVVSCELFLCRHEEIDKRIPIYFRLLKCRSTDYVNKTCYHWPGALFSEDGHLLAFYNANSITVVNTSDGSLYTSVCLYHNSLTSFGSSTEILYLSKERIVIKDKSIFSFSFTGESRPERRVAIEHVYFLPGNVRIFFISSSSNNIRELWCESLIKHNDLLLQMGVEREHTFTIEKYIFLEG